MTTGLEATDLVCVRGEREVFNGLGFRLTPGATLVLKGPNGCGKSSLLRMVAGLLAPADGSLSWNGKPVADDPDGYRENLCLVGHLDAVKPVFTVAENLAFWTAISGRPKADVNEALGKIGLAGLAGLPAQYLSAGQKRRLNLARLWASPATLWLLDEPTVALDSEASRALMAVLAEHRGTGGMAMIATHTDLGIEGSEEFRFDGTAGRPG